MLHQVQGLFFFNKSQFLLFKCCFFFGNGCFQFDALVYFLLLLLIQVAVSDIESFKGGLSQLNSYFFVLFFDFKILLRFFGLTFQTFQLVVDFKKQVFNTCKVLFGSIQFQFRFPFPCFVDGDSCSLFKHFAAGIVFVFYDIVNHPQFDDCVTVGTHPCIHE